MFLSLEKKKNLIREIIQMCVTAITEWEKGIFTGIISDISGDSRNGLEFYYNQVKNIILPEMKQLLICAEEKGNLRDHMEKGAKYNYILSDCWELKTHLSKKILKLSQHLS